MGEIKGTYGVEKIFYRPLLTTGSTTFKELPTIVAGDFQVSTDGGAWTNLDTLPTEVPGGTEQVKITVSAVEMEGEQISIRAIDAAGAEWEPAWWTIETEANTLLNDLLGALANVGSAINTPAESYALATGTESANNVAATSPLDGVHHEHTDDGGGVLDLYYQFAIGGDGVPSSVHVTGRINGKNDDLDGLYAYNWGGGVWDRIGDFEGQANSVDQVRDYDLFTSHVGTGVNLGKVRIRFWAAAGLTSATLAIDQIFIAYSVVARSVGYAEGAIWVDTNASNENTESFVDGTGDNPVSTWAAALTLSVALNIKRFHIIGGSTITLTGNSDRYAFLGHAWTLALGGQSCANATIHGAHVTGTCTGTVVHFDDCTLADTADLITDVAHFRECAIAGSIICTGAGTYYWEACFSGVAGVATPSVDFGAAIGSTNLNLRHYSGGIEIKNMGRVGSDLMSLEGHGQLVINANCTGGTVAIRGHFTVTDNASDVVTLSDNARYDIDQITAAVAPGGGAFAVDITTQEADTTPISEVSVSIYTDSARTNLFATVDTGLTGTYTGLGMDAGTYYWAASKVGVTFASGSFTISASGEEVLVGTVETPSLPSSPNLCVIFGTLRNAGGVVLVGADINVYAITPQIVSGVQMDNRIASATSSVTGYFELELEKGAEVRLVIELANRDETLTVPDAANQDIATWTA